MKYRVKKLILRLTNGLNPRHNSTPTNQIFFRLEIKICFVVRINIKTYPKEKKAGLYYKEGVECGGIWVGMKPCNVLWFNKREVEEWGVVGVFALNRRKLS